MSTVGYDEIRPELSYNKCCVTTKATQTIKEYIDFAKKIALKAGDIMVKLEGSSFTPTENINYINEYVARQIGLFVAEQIKTVYPTHNLFDFKPALSENYDYEWICDYDDYFSIMEVILFLGGIQLLLLSIIGEYVSHFFLENKNKPLYFTEEYHEST